MMPIRQRCPSCGEEFMGSDAIGSECMSCETRPKGRLIIYEGSDIVGKSTITKLTHEWLDSLHRKSVIAAQPGATDLGKKLREIVKHDKNIELGVETEAMIFLLDHMSFVETKLNKWLVEGYWVLSDRNDFVSGLVYQVLRGVNPDRLKQFYSTINTPRADILFILRASEESTRNRAMARNDGKWDRYEENKGFAKKVRETYARLIEDKSQYLNDVADNTIYVDTDDGIEATIQIIKDHLKLLM